MFRWAYRTRNWGAIRRSELDLQDCLGPRTYSRFCFILIFSSVSYLTLTSHPMGELLGRWVSMKSKAAPRLVRPLWWCDRYELRTGIYHYVGLTNNSALHKWSFFRVGICSTKGRSSQWRDKHTTGVLWSCLLLFCPVAAHFVFFFLILACISPKEKRSQIWYVFVPRLPLHNLLRYKHCP